MLRTSNEPVSGRSSTDETHARILSAAREIYARKGSRGTTTREVAELAGVNEATLFRHFGTKGQLIAAMLDVYCYRTAYPQLIASLSGPLEADLHVLMASAIENMTSKEDLIKVGMAEEFTNPDGGQVAFRGPAEARRCLVEFFGERVAAGELRGQPQDLARMFLALPFAYVMGRRIWSDPDISAQSIVPILTDLFLNGARAH